MHRNDQCPRLDTARHEPFIWSLNIRFQRKFLVRPLCSLQMHPQMVSPTYHVSIAFHNQIEDLPIFLVHGSKSHNLFPLGLFCCINESILFSADPLRFSRTSTWFILISSYCGWGYESLSAVNKTFVLASGGFICQLSIYTEPSIIRTVDDSKAAIRSIGSGSRTIEVTYHQYGTASRMSSGKARVVTIRRGVEGLTFAVSSAGVALRGLPGPASLLEVDMSTVECRVVMQTPKVSHGC